jgi:hypothetical protein
MAGELGRSAAISVFASARIFPAGGTDLIRKKGIVRVLSKEIAHATRPDALEN